MLLISLKQNMNTLMDPYATKEKELANSCVTCIKYIIEDIVLVSDKDKLILHLIQFFFV